MPRVIQHVAEILPNPGELQLAMGAETQLELAAATGSSQHPSLIC